MDKYKCLGYLAIIAAILFILLELFFNSTIIALLGMLISLFMHKKIKKYIKNQNLKKSEKEFMVFISSLSSALSVGKSFESSFVESVEELKKEGNEYLIIEDLKKIVNNYEMNITISDGLKEFANKYKTANIMNFSNILEVTIRQGGDLNNIIEDTIHRIEEKNEVEEELEVLITQKKFELYMLLSFVPIMIFYMKGISNVFYTTMYETMIGKIIMLVCLILYIISGILGKKIVDIKI